MVIWTAIALIVNTFSIFTVFYECAFRMRAKTEEASYEKIFEIILCLEVILIFFKSYPVSQDHQGWVFSFLRIFGCCKKSKSEQDYDENRSRLADQFEKSFRLVGIHYLSGVFIFDFLSVYPYFIGALAHSGQDYQEVMQLSYMRVFGYLRLFRIT